MPQSTRIALASWCGAATSEPFAIAAADTQVAVPDLRLGVPSTIEGTVVDEQRKPLPGIRVWLRDWDLSTQSQRSGVVVEVITDRKGRYRFVGAPPGDAYLQLLVVNDHPHSNAVEPFEVEVGKTYTFELQVPKPQ
jgi:protocatechuate 3,4-dioxygenase beta subunit